MATITKNYSHDAGIILAVDAALANAASFDVELPKGIGSNYMAQVIDNTTLLPLAGSYTLAETAETATANAYLTLTNGTGGDIDVTLKIIVVV